MRPPVMLRFKIFKTEHYGGHMTTQNSPKKGKRRFRFSFLGNIFGPNWIPHRIRGKLHFLRIVSNFAFCEALQTALLRSASNCTFCESSQISLFARRSKLHFFAKRTDLNFLRSVTNCTFREASRISLFLRIIPNFTFCEAFQT